MTEIIHCITTISLGGAEKQLFTLVDQQIKSGKKVTVFYLKDKPDLKQKFEDIGATVLDELANKNFMMQIFVLRKFLKSKKTIVHAHLPRAELICSLSKRQNYLVISKHNSERFFPKGNSILSRTLSLFVFSRSSKCICISLAVKNFLVQLKEIESGDKIHVVHYGYSKIDEVLLNNQLAKISLGIEKYFVIGTIARLVPQKNYQVLLEAFSIFRLNKTNAKLLIIGNGVLKEYIFNLAKELRIYDCVIWVPSTTEVYRHLSAMDMFVLASNYEGFGLVLLEAMQSSTPIVSAKNSSTPEVLGENYPGFFETSNINDLVEKMNLAADQQFRNKLINTYQERLTKFDPYLMSQHIFSCYAKAIKAY